MSSYGIVLKVIKIYGEKTHIEMDWFCGLEDITHLYPEGTKRIVLKFCPFELKVKKVVQKCVIKYVCEMDSAGVKHYNKWYDIDYDGRLEKIKKLKNKIKR